MVNAFGTDLKGCIWYGWINSWKFVVFMQDDGGCGDVGLGVEVGKAYPLLKEMEVRYVYLFELTLLHSKGCLFYVKKI